MLLFCCYNTLAATSVRLSLAAKQTAASSPAACVCLQAPHNSEWSVDPATSSRVLVVDAVTSKGPRGEPRLYCSALGHHDKYCSMKKKCVSLAAVVLISRMYISKFVPFWSNWPLQWRRSNRMNCTHRGRCDVTFPLAMLPPAAISNTQLVRRNQVFAGVTAAAAAHRAPAGNFCTRVGRNSATCENPHRSLLCVGVFCSPCHVKEEGVYSSPGATFPFKLRHKGDSEISLFPT